MAIRAIAKVAEAYKRDQQVTPSFRPHGAMVYDERLANFPTPDRVSLLTLEGRALVPFRFGGYAEGMLPRRRGQCDLLYRRPRDTFSLAIPVDAPEPTPDDGSDDLGVDLGVLTRAATSDGEFLNRAIGPQHAHVNQVSARSSRIGQQLPAKGRARETSSGAAGGRERRCAKDGNPGGCPRPRPWCRRRKAQGAAWRLQTARPSAAASTVLRASGACCTGGRPANCGPSSPTRQHRPV